MNVLLPVVAYEPVNEFSDVLPLLALNEFKDVFPFEEVNEFILLTLISTLALLLSQLVILGENDAVALLIDVRISMTCAPPLTKVGTLVKFV